MTLGPRQMQHLGEVPLAHAFARREQSQAHELARDERPALLKRRCIAWR